MGKVYVRLRLLEGNVLEITVRDKGCGIPDVPQAMEPLFSTGGEERSGMGFTIMDSFMDGLRVKSAPGKGTTVTMSKRIKVRG
jgi:stage II sporulation protein AB (anti-sigma F factor)